MLWFVCSRHKERENKETNLHTEVTLQLYRNCGKVKDYKYVSKNASKLGSSNILQTLQQILYENWNNYYVI